MQILNRDGAPIDPDGMFVACLDIPFEYADHVLHRYLHDEEAEEFLTLLRVFKGPTP
jgi:hypothetical protein